MPASLEPLTGSTHDGGAMTDAVETERLLLRPPVDADLDAVWRIHSDPRTNRFNPAPPMASPVAARIRLNDMLTDWRVYGHGYWTVLERSTPTAVVGFGGLRQTLWRGRRVWNLYYRLDPAAWGRGLGAELARAAVAAWRELPGGLPLIAYTTSENVPSQKTAAAAGLERRTDLDEQQDGYLEVAFALGWDEPPAGGERPRVG
jgi:[ribosomal protein S5]-alanine N-acetyltransferase